MRTILPGLQVMVFPDEPRGWAGFKARHACRRAGGHFWHITICRPCKFGACEECK